MNKPYPVPVLGLLALVLVLLLSACSGTRRISGEAPLVGMDALRLVDSSAVIDLRARNVNTVPLPVERVTFRLRHGDEILAERDSEPGIDLVANGTEEFTVELGGGPRLRELLGALERGERDEMSFRLDGRIRSTGKTFEFEQRGRLYPIPGRPGHFRATGASLPQDRRRDRRDPLRSTGVPWAGGAAARDPADG